MTPRARRLTTWLVERSLPSADRQAVLGDLAEEFDALAQRDGSRSARRWYRRQARRSADAGYFSTFQIPLIAGRFFSDHDTATSEPVAIVDEPFAEHFWPHADPIGKHLWFDPKQPFVITGVVGGVKQYGLDSDAKIVVYFPSSQTRPAPCRSGSTHRWPGGASP